MEIIYKGLTDLIPYQKNPRKNDDAVKYVKASIQEFGFKVPIIIDSNNIIIAGHTRYKAAKSLKLKEVPCIIAADLTDEQIKAFRLADNKVGELAEWDDDLLAEEIGGILDIDMSDFGFDIDFESDVSDSQSNTTEFETLSESFVAPPISILDTRQGYWQNRKKQWKKLGLQSELGREQNLIGSPDKADYMNTAYKGAAPQTSVFDPVLCEVAYKWFNVDGGKIYDCFAGGSVRGIVAAKLGYDYVGIDLRQEQIDANYVNATKIGVTPKWICDDSLNADNYIPNNSVDMIFSCPPYADLEKYSDDARDISNMDYDDFKNVYHKIIDIACKKLKKDRFAVFVVGDVRNKKGFYRNLIDYTKQCFNENGLLTYNELILVEQIGTGAMRARKTFLAGRKVVKVHQNVLVFYKGDPKNIKSNYKEIDVSDFEIGDEENGE